MTTTLLPLLLLLASPAPAFEARVHAQIVELRRNPKGYAAKLRKYRKRFDGKLVRVEGRVDLATQEGTRAVDEAIRVLERTQPLPPLPLSRGLSQGEVSGAALRRCRGSVRCRLRLRKRA